MSTSAIPANCALARQSKTALQLQRSRPGHSALTPHAAMMQSFGLTLVAVNAASAADAPDSVTIVPRGVAFWQHGAARRYGR